VLVYLIAGEAVAASASVGMLTLSIGDQTAPARGKLRQIAPLLWLAAPMTLAVQLAHLAPQYTAFLIGALVCTGGFIGMLGTAWGVRGAPLGFALVLAIVFAMSTPPPPDGRSALIHVAWFEFGALLYSAYAVLSARVLNTRFRTQALAEAMAELSVMLRQQGARLAATGDRRESQLRALLAEQAVLADKLQVARDLVLDAPRSVRQMHLAAMLIALIRLREQALAVELELDMQATRAAAMPSLAEVRALETLWHELAEGLDRVCWSLFSGAPWQRSTFEPRLSVARVPAPLQGACAAMISEMREIAQWADARSPAPPAELSARARDWPRFRTSMRWPIAPLKRALTGRSPVLRYAARVALALGVGYWVALNLPWAAHPHWILLTIAVVMRTNIAQTLERRNARLLGTVFGCVLVTALLSLHPSVPMQLALLALGAGVAHGFAQVRYLVAATAATVLALIQGHLLQTAGEFALFERLADTLIGTFIAWGFSYVLPAWERRQLPALLTRLKNAQRQHAQVALGNVELASANADWRLARREVLDCLAAIATAAQRASAEPRGVRPPLDLLERAQLRSYRLLAQLGGVRTWREQPHAMPEPEAEPLLTRSLAKISAGLEAAGDMAEAPAHIETLTETVSAHEASAALRQRLVDAIAEARALGADLAAAQAWEASRLARKER
jgi:Fusaric acid resistance protein-like/FUSC-like inner membrane protein yccS